MVTGIERSSETHTPHNQTPSLMWMYFCLLKQISLILTAIFLGFYPM